MHQVLIRKNFLGRSAEKVTKKRRERVGVGTVRQQQKRGREKVNLIENDNKERSLLEVKRERRRELLAATEKAVFGLAGLTYSRRYTATNDDVSLPLRKRSSGRLAVFCILSRLKSPLLYNKFSVALDRSVYSSGCRDDVQFKVIRDVITYTLLSL